ADYASVSGPAFGAGGGPGVPANLAATGGSKKVDLAWNAPASGPAPTGYTVLRGSSGGPYTKVNDVAASPTSYTDTGLADSTKYCYVVQTKAGAATSGNSNEACATTSPGGVLTFRRGDVDGNGVVEITDPVHLLGY